MARTPAAAPAARPSSLLSGLKFSTAKKSVQIKALDPKMRARAKMVEGINEMIKYVQADINKEEYTPSVMRYVTDEDGNKSRKSMPKRRSLWYWFDGKTWLTECKYGSSALEFEFNQTAIECGPELADVVSVLDTLIEATELGELDDELAKLAVRRGRPPNAPVEEPASPRERLAARATTRR